MSNEITVKSAPAVVVAAHRTATTLAEVFNHIPAGFATVMAALSEADIGPVGVPFTLYHQAPDGDTAGDIAMCVPIASTIDDAAYGVDTIELAAETAASVLHKGSYDDIGESYAEIANWIQEGGHRIVGPTREVYHNSPAEVADDDLLTEIFFPIDAVGARG